jgi:hypothetical protein
MLSVSLAQKHKQNLNRLIRYYMAPNENFNQTFICLDDVKNSDAAVTNEVVCKIAYELIKALCVLHVNSLRVHKLHNNTVYTNVENGKVS